MMPLSEALESQLVHAARQDGVGRLVVAALVERKGRVLLLRRRHDDFMGGTYELPSGRVEDGETLASALRREVTEETGLLVEAVDDYLGCFNYLSSGGTGTRQFNFLVAVADFFAIRLTEHDAFAWASPADLVNLRVTEQVRNVLEQAAFREVRPGNSP